AQTPGARPPPAATAKPWQFQSQAPPLANVSRPVCSELRPSGSDIEIHICLAIRQSEFRLSIRVVRRFYDGGSSTLPSGHSAIRKRQRTAALQDASRFRAV